MNRFVRNKSAGHHIQYSTPAYRWDEGLPGGNGWLGLLVWGDGRPLNLSVDRSDLWDNREDPKTKHPDFEWRKLIEYLEAGNMAAIGEIFEKGRDSTPYPTKLPCGRLTLNFRKVGADRKFESRLEFATAQATVTLGKIQVLAYVHATEEIIVVQARGAVPRVRFVSPFDASQTRPGETSGGYAISSIQYPVPRRGKRGAVHYVLQPCAESMAYAVVWKMERVRHDWFLFLTVQQAQAGKDPVALAIDKLNEVLSAGPARLERTHLAWWRNYWKRGHVRLPDARLEHLWYSEMYKLGACARADTPPIALQGVWTADEMSLPPWRGDYHHDLNTEQCYWPVHTSGRWEQSLGLARWLSALLPKYRAFAREFYDAPGANAPGSHGLHGQTVRGWAGYVYSRANTAWLIQHLWLHYRYTIDRDYLRDIAYPFIREITRFVASQVEKDRGGVYHIRYSTSPEFFDNRRESYGEDSTYDLSLIRHALKIACAAAAILGTDAGEAAGWKHLHDHLPSYPISPPNPLSPSPEGGLALWKGQRLSESHRHLAQCMPIFPLGDVHVEGGDADRKIIQDTLCELESMGTGFWCGYSYAWMACIGARVREPNRAVWALRQFLDCFVSRNGFHLNGDFKRQGASRLHYRPFTLEGDLAAGHAVNEMLIQSWGNKIRLFPAIPGDWTDVWFTDLRAEGAFSVSAWRKNGEFDRAEIRSEAGELLRLEHPHAHKAVLVEISGKKTRHLPGRDIAIKTKPGMFLVMSAW